MPDPLRYDRVALLLHWLTALAVFGLLGLGFVMTSLPPASSLQFQLFQWHKSVGISVLALTLLRLAWRLLYRPPALPAAMPVWEKLAAEANHVLLYALLLLMPLCGWALVSVARFNVPTVLYGVLPWPHLPVLATLPDKAPVETLMRRLHDAGGWLLVALLALHIGAALRHHWLLGDDVLRRMLPRFASTSRRSS